MTKKQIDKCQYWIYRHHQIIKYPNSQIDNVLTEASYIAALLSSVNLTFAMHETLFQYVETRSKQKLTDEDQGLILSKFNLKRYRKRQYFLQEGDVCKYAAFIVQGSARMFSIDGKGIEHIVRFGLESWWLGDLESFYELTPSRYNIEILENSELLIISQPNANELRDKCRPFDLAIKAMDHGAHVAAQKRIDAAISLTAEERYDELAKTHPEFLQRFPQNMIASYLGLSPETLSRVRKHMLYK